VLFLIMSWCSNIVLYIILSIVQCYKHADYDISSLLYDVCIPYYYVFLVKFHKRTTYARRRRSRDFPGVAPRCTCGAPELLSMHCHYILAMSLQALCVSLALGCVVGTFSCTVHVWECLQSPVGWGSGLASHGMLVPTDEHGLL
jgi:hypothetical protein